MTTAGELLLPRISGKTIVELGCGTGPMAESLIEAGATSYLGFDIADSAVEAAQARVDAAGLSGKIQFKQGSMADIGEVDAYIVFSMGLHVPSRIC
jgi:predicted RNA methylase